MPGEAFLYPLRKETGVMQIIEGRTVFQIEGKSAVAIGKFDGIHRGHLALLSHILEQKKKGLLAAVFTFYPSASAFFGSQEEKELTTISEKRRIFEALGVDVLVEFPLNQKTAGIPAERFVTDILAGQMRAAYIAAGTDLSFGAKGRGNKELLQAMAGSFGCEVEIIDKVMEKEREISSTYVREEVEKGRMEEAAGLLGRFYSIAGTVESGKRLGRRLGMPTLNLYPGKDKLLPPYGVYYSLTHYQGSVWEGITNIGKKPTVKDTSLVSAETYLYDFSGDVYGKEIVTELLHFKRPERKFADVEALKAQMEEDLREGRRYHASRGNSIK